MGGAEHIGAKLVAIAVKVRENRVQLAQIPHQVKPGDLFSLDYGRFLRIAERWSGYLPGNDVQLS